MGRRGNPPSSSKAGSICRPHHGGEGNRTPDLLNAIQALSQLSYAPAPNPFRGLDEVGRQEPRSIAAGILRVNETALAEFP
jgi:hypothetical protein